MAVQIQIHFVHSQLYQSIEDYIDWYNTLRLHSSLGYLTPFRNGTKIKRNYEQSGLRKLVTKILGGPGY